MNTPASPAVNTVAVVGLGLIGGSFARDIRTAGFADRILGVDNNSQHAARARELQLVDATASLADAANQADLTIIAVPVDAAEKLLPQVLDSIGPHQTVTDVCSTKATLLNAVHQHPRRDRFVAGHPMAGTEHSGPDAALSGLFHDKVGIICNREESAPGAVALIEQLYRALGMRIEYLDGQRHDMHVAFVSHVSHAISYALALTVLEKERDERQIFNLASGGFSSTARLAKSSASMWTPIFLANRDNVLSVLDTYLEKLSELRTAIEDNDSQTLNSLIAAANDIRRVLQ